MLQKTTFLSHSYAKPDGHTLAAYESAGGYKNARKALGMSRDAVVDEVKKAKIRGRGGAGFDCGTKWTFMPKESKKPCYLVVNADEGEPGTFKDRTIMERNPHSVVEGCIIGCFGIGAHAAYIYVRDELHLSKERLWAAIEEARAKGYLGQKPFGLDYPVEVYVQTGAGAYICGEETALLNSLEGRRGDALTQLVRCIVAAHLRPLLVRHAQRVRRQVRAHETQRLVERGNVWSDAARATLRALVRAHGVPKYTLSMQVSSFCPST